MRWLPILLSVAVTAVAADLAIWLPAPFSDKNAFLRGFMNQELLALLGVIVTITLGSTAMLNLELNKVQEGTGEGFPEARLALKRSAMSLIAAFVLALALVIAKPLLACSLSSEAAFNLGGVLLILFNLTVLVDIQLAAFRIPPIERH